MRVERHETDAARWEVARRDPVPTLRSVVVRGLEGWAQMRGDAPALREVPFPGIPLILNLGAPWEVDGERRRHAFTAGMSTQSSTVCGESRWACVELRLTPQGAHRVFDVAMHELANHTVELGDLVPGARELEERLRDATDWARRFDLVEAFLLQRLAEARPTDPAVAWSWHHLRETHGRTPIGGLAAELGWSHRRLISRFREQIGLTPKTVARVMRFDRATTAVREQDRPLAEIAYAYGYADQAHFNREFRELAGISPGRFRVSLAPSGAVAA